MELKGGQSMGPVGFCLCPQCGERVHHQAVSPAKERSVPSVELRWSEKVYIIVRKIKKEVLYAITNTNKS